MNIYMAYKFLCLPAKNIVKAFKVKNMAFLWLTRYLDTSVCDIFNGWVQAERESLTCEDGYYTIDACEYEDSRMAHYGSEGSIPYSCSRRMAIRVNKIEWDATIFGVSPLSLIVQTTGIKRSLVHTQTVVADRESVNSDETINHIMEGLLPNRGYGLEEKRRIFDWETRRFSVIRRERWTAGVPKQERHIGYKRVRELNIDTGNFQSLFSPSFLYTLGKVSSDTCMYEANSRIEVCKGGGIFLHETQQEAWSAIVADAYPPRKHDQVVLKGYYWGRVNIGGDKFAAEYFLPFEAYKSPGHNGIGRLVKKST